MNDATAWDSKYRVSIEDRVLVEVVFHNRMVKAMERKNRERSYCDDWGFIEPIVERYLKAETVAETLLLAPK